jgi:hypothetical protein
MKKIPLLCAALAGACLLFPRLALAAKADNADLKAIAKYDSNKNGKIDPEEFASLRKSFAAKPNGELARIDADHDGKLSDDELAAALPAKKRVRSDADKTERKAKRGDKKKKPGAAESATAEKPESDAKPAAEAKPALEK